jgi:hypothetical protein
MMTVAEIIDMQRRKCEADKLDRLRRRAELKPSAPATLPAKMTVAERERAFIEDRTYDGRPPEGGMAGTIRKECPEEYVARDGTSTFVPWRYVSMRDLELPDAGNPYRKPDSEGAARKPADPWGRPSGYAEPAGIAGHGADGDPWAVSGAIPAAQGVHGGSWDDWLSPSADGQQGAVHPAASQQPAVDGGWLAQPIQDGPAQPVGQMGIDANGTLDIMRSMRH